MQTSNNNITATHCKVHCGKEFRRFLLPSSQFEALSTQVRTLFGFTLDEPISIKYTDEEGDMVTISSDEELKFAIELFAGGLIRLTVIQPKNRACHNTEGNKWGCRWSDKNWSDKSGCKWSDKAGCNPEGNKWGCRWSDKKWSDKAGCKWENKCEGKASDRAGCKWEKKGGNQRECGDMWKEKWEAKLISNPQLLQKKIQQFQFKLNKLKDRKQFLDTKGCNNPSLPHRMAPLQTKIERVEARLAQLQGLASKGGASPQEDGSQIKQITIYPVLDPVTPVQPTAPYLELETTESSSCEDFREMMKPLKQQIKALRQAVQAGSVSRGEAAGKIFTLQEEIAKIKAARKEKKMAKQSRQ